MSDFNEIVSNIKCKQDFLNFIQLLIEDLHKNQWGNNTLSSYLEGMEGWVDDMDGYFKNIQDYETLRRIKNNEVDWKIFASILIASSMYE
ncbi:DUF7660 family protein [Acinetobacter lanii]|uniref:DUF7660 domain-containing protein n=1 Tax=Acinetobacter lanii TaxID=2715163 RepID=A0A6G8S3Z2_9GAMM|nr:hypothetical protein [Acinetobacter lanii]QIO08936.1 hypothetical protein G8D99_07865 [Acinetobacter lanii]